MVPTLPSDEVNSDFGDIPIDARNRIVLVGRGYVAFALMALLTSYLSLREGYWSLPTSVLAVFGGSQNFREALGSVFAVSVLGALVLELAAWVIIMKHRGPMLPTRSARIRWQIAGISILRVTVTFAAMILASEMLFWILAVLEPQ